MQVDPCKVRNPPVLSVSFCSQEQEVLADPMFFTPASTLHEQCSSRRLRVQVAGASAVTRCVCCREEIEAGVFAFRSFVCVRRTITHNRLARTDFVVGSIERLP